MINSLFSLNDDNKFDITIVYGDINFKNLFDNPHPKISNKYKNKYLKYKNKYLEIKNKY